MPAFPFLPTSPIMDLPNQTLLYILLVAGGQGLALAATLFLHRPRTLHTNFFSLFILLISLGCLDKSIGGLFFPSPHTGLPLPLANPLSYYAALYLHLVYLSQPERVFRRINLLHFGPAFILDFLSYYYLSWPGNPSPFGFISGMGIPIFELVYTIIFIVHFLAYASAIHRIHQRQIASAHQALIVRWLNYLKPLLLIFWTSWIIVKLIGKDNLLGYGVSFIIHGTAILFIYGLGYSYLLKMRHAFDCSPGRKQIANKPDFDPLEIVEQMRRSKIHRNQQISLASTAKQLSIPQKTLSQAINLSEGSNFSDFVNQLRIDEFRERLQATDSAHLSLFGLAQEVGFSSKSSFHRAFKKQTNRTPGEYLKYLSESGKGKVPDRDPTPLAP